MKLIAEYRAEEFTSAVVPYAALKQVAHGMVCLSDGWYIFVTSSVRDAIIKPVSTKCRL